MKRFSFIAAVLLCFVTMAGAAIRPAQPGIGGGGSTVSGSITGAYSFNGGLTTINATNVYLTPAISNLVLNLAVTNVGATLLEASNYFARVVSLTTNDDIATIIAASANDTAYFLAPGYYTVTPAVARDTGSGAINIKNKTNILIQGVYGSTFIDGRSVLGDNFWITNSSGITLRWLTSLGRVVTNFVTVAAPGQFSHVSYYNVEKLSIEENQFLHGYDHGTLDMASQANWTSVSTNFIRIVRNYFDNFGSSRTNESTAYDGTAIVPIAGVIEGNVIVNSIRGIEPYADGVKATGRVIDGQTFIRNNQIIDGLEAGITFAGSTNIHGVVIENNTIRFTPGYSRRGTNTLTFAGGIEINGGQRHIVRGNKVYNPQYYGILVNATTTTGPAYGMVIEDNYIEGATNQYGSAAFGIYAADISDTLVNPIIDATISGNKLRRISHQALRVLGGRNVVVENNRFDDVAFPGFTAALQVQSSTSVSSNVTVRNNFITDRTGNLGTGISISAGTKAVRLMGNDVLGFTSVAVDSLAGPTESREYNTDASSTNRMLRAHEVRTQIEAGSNITLATNSSGVVTITGAAGGGSSISTNGNQFGASVPITIKDGVLLTNATISTAVVSGSLNSQGDTTLSGSSGITANRVMYLDISKKIQTSATVTDTELGYLDNVTSAIQTQLDSKVATNGTTVISSGSLVANAFIGSGTGVPIIKLQTMMSVDNSLAFSVRTNFTQLSTNFFEFTSPAVGQRMRLHSVSNGQLVWTNAYQDAITVSGAGSGNTNYTINLIPGDVNDFYMGSSNVMITAVMGGVVGVPIYWNAYITNLSAATWGIGFSAVTNRWRFSGVNGTNSPVVLTNNTMLQISGRTDGTNTLVGYTYYAPGL
ncbi:Right handed beta helix region [uncultured Caudovirales phage]|uniref:Right handed beta helix region n=1 Tax=uncultured Caudovirales phage TaxID=2100421 RepID=A0A6J7XAL1_9CAUD|nr:Right handed beta helix region [uncultured Caudovirales phage]CAB5227893.1 Right handed beta helix region [uncultured Caudovirales phage]